MKKNKVVIVVPTIRKESFDRFLNEWKDEFFKNKKFTVYLIVVEDNHQKTFALEKNPNIFHFCWEDIEKDLKKDSWIIPRRSDCVRSYGYLKAYQMKPDMIITLDDDCYPLEKYKKTNLEKRFIETHWENLNLEKSEESWISTINTYRPRGIPYKKTCHPKRKNYILNHGLWFNVPDFDGKTQLKIKKNTGLSGYEIYQNIPKGKYFPMCGMNISWKPNLTPALYFLLMGKDQKGISFGYDRFGDIWAGIIAKKIIDHLDYRVYSGGPIVWHDRASNALINQQKEIQAIKDNEVFWQKIDRIKLTKNTFKDCYKELARGLELEGKYWSKIKKAMIVWSNLF